MEVLVEGSGGSSGWPEPGCRCASCLGATSAGKLRGRSAIVADDTVRLGGAAGPDGAEGAEGDIPGGFRVLGLPDARDAGGLGGWDVT